MAVVSRGCQATAPEALRGLCLPVSRTGKVPSPYFQMFGPVRKVGRAGRVKKLTLTEMKVVVASIHDFNAVNKTINIEVLYESGGSFSEYAAEVDITGCASFADVRAAVNALIIANAPSSITESDIQWPTLDPRKAQDCSFANPSRSLNSAFQISASRDALVSYAVDIAATLTLSGGATGTVFLEYADDSGFTTNVVEVNRTVNGNTGTLTVDLSLTQNATGTLAGLIPAGKYVRLRTANTTGSPSFTFRRAQEVLL